MILEMHGMRKEMAFFREQKVAVRGIVGGRALKGPADKMLLSLGHEVSSAGVAAIYAGLVDGMVVDTVDDDDRAGIEAIGMRVLVTDSVMREAGDRARLASETLKFGVGMVAR